MRRICLVLGLSAAALVYIFYQLAVVDELLARNFYKGAATAPCFRYDQPSSASLVAEEESVKNGATSDVVHAEERVMESVGVDIGQNTATSYPNAVMTIKRYHEYPNQEFVPQKLKHVKKMYKTAYEEATVYERADPWFVPQKKCKENIKTKTRCCAETVAISLDQDDHHIINTVDGLDVADLVIERFSTRKGLSFFATHLKTDEDDLSFNMNILPCIQRGTIIHIDNYASNVTKFFNEIAPDIRTKFVLITSETDLNSPVLPEPLKKDRRLMKLYAQSVFLPLIRKDENYDTALAKLVGFPLGLSKWHDQSRYLTRYLELRNFTNPFSGDEIKRWTNAAVWDLLEDPSADLAAIEDAFYDTMFIKFGINPASKAHRQPIFNHLCSDIGQNETRKRVGVSCNSTAKVPNHQLYQAASQYLFGISPDGAGWECYRTYELLLLGVIPIVSTRLGGTYGLFENLPVLEMNLRAMRSMSKLDMLRAMRDYVRSDAFVNADFEKGWERLFLRYWRRDILKAAGRDKDILIEPGTGREFYQAWRYSSSKSRKQTTKQ